MTRVHGRFEEVMARPAVDPSERLDGMGSRIEQIAERLEAANVRVKAVEDTIHAGVGSLSAAIENGVDKIDRSVDSRPDRNEFARVLRDSQHDSERRITQQLDGALADFAEVMLGGQANPKGSGARPVVARRARKVTRTRTDFVPVDQVYEPEFVLVGEPVVSEEPSAGYPYATPPERALEQPAARYRALEPSVAFTSPPVEAVPVVAPVVERGGCRARTGSHRRTGAGSAKAARKAPAKAAGASRRDLATPARRRPPARRRRSPRRPSRRRPSLRPRRALTISAAPLSRRRRARRRAQAHHQADPAAQDRGRRPPGGA